MPVDKALGRESDFAVLHARFQKVADLHMHLLTDVLRNHDLKLVFYSDDIHEHVLLVQLLNSTTLESRRQSP